MNRIFGAVVVLILFSAKPAICSNVWGETFPDLTQYHWVCTGANGSQYAQWMTDYLPTYKQIDNPQAYYSLAETWDCSLTMAGTSSVDTSSVDNSWVDTAGIDAGSTSPSVSASWSPPSNDDSDLMKMLLILAILGQQKNTQTQSSSILPLLMGF